MIPAKGHGALPAAPFNGTLLAGGRDEYLRTTSLVLTSERPPSQEAADRWDHPAHRFRPTRSEALDKPPNGFAQLAVGEPPVLLRLEPGEPVFAVHVGVVPLGRTIDEDACGIDV